MEAKDSADASSLQKSDKPCLGHDEQCPLCGGDNQCRVAKGHLYKGPCWCHEIAVPGHVLKRLAEGRFEPACLCRSCLETVARISQTSNDTEIILAEVQRVISSKPAVPQEEDFYLDENGYTVFTATYHLKRGTCCDNQCRHCPY